MKIICTRFFIIYFYLIFSISAVAGKFDGEAAAGADLYGLMENVSLQVTKPVPQNHKSISSFDGTWKSLKLYLAEQYQGFMEKKLAKRTDSAESSFCEDFEVSPDTSGSSKKICALCNGEYSMATLHKLTFAERESLLKLTQDDSLFEETHGGVSGGQADMYIKTDFVIKKAKAERDNQRLVREANALAALQCDTEAGGQYTAELLWCCLDPKENHVLLFLKRYQSDAFNFVAKKKAVGELKSVALQLAKGILSESRQSISNCDIKDMNILGDFNSDLVTSVVLADYGYAINLDCDDCWKLQKKGRITDYNASPEARTGSPHVKSEVWSLAVFLLESYFGPYGAGSFAEICRDVESDLKEKTPDYYKSFQKKIKKGYSNFQLLSIYSKKYPRILYEAVKKVLDAHSALNENMQEPFLQDYKELLIRMMHYDPDCRPSAEELVREWEN